MAGSPGLTETCLPIGSSAKELAAYAKQAAPALAEALLTREIAKYLSRNNDAPGLRHSEAGARTAEVDHIARLAKLNPQEVQLFFRSPDNLRDSLFSFYDKSGRVMMQFRYNAERNSVLWITSPGEVKARQADAKLNNEAQGREQKLSDFATKWRSALEEIGRQAELPNELPVTERFEPWPSAISRYFSTPHYRSKLEVSVPRALVEDFYRIFRPGHEPLENQGVEFTLSRMEQDARLLNLVVTDRVLPGPAMVSKDYVTPAMYVGAATVWLPKSSSVIGVESHSGFGRSVGPSLPTALSLAWSAGKACGVLPFDTVANPESSGIEIAMVVPLTKLRMIKDRELLVDTVMGLLDGTQIGMSRRALSAPMPPELLAKFVAKHQEIFSDKTIVKILARTVDPLKQGDGDIHAHFAAKLLTELHNQGGSDKKPSRAAWALFQLGKTERLNNERFVGSEQERSELESVIGVNNLTLRDFSRRNPKIVRQTQLLVERIKNIPPP